MKNREMKNGDRDREWTTSEIVVWTIFGVLVMMGGCASLRLGKAASSLLGL